MDNVGVTINSANYFRRLNNKIRIATTVSILKSDLKLIDDISSTNNLSEVKLNALLKEIIINILRTVSIYVWHFSAYNKDIIKSEALVKEDSEYYKGIVFRYSIYHSHDIDINITDKGQDLIDIIGVTERLLEHISDNKFKIINLAKI